jgi:hypothetical protein
MSSTDARRQRRRMKRDIIKNIQGQERNLKIPTEEDIQKYIDNMVEQIKLQEDVQLQETTES